MVKWVQRTLEEHQASCQSFHCSTPHSNMWVLYLDPLTQSHAGSSHNFTPAVSSLFSFLMLSRSCDLLRASCCFYNLLKSSLPSNSLPVTSCWPVSSAGSSCKHIHKQIRKLIPFSLSFFLKRILSYTFNVTRAQCVLHPLTHTSHTQFHTNCCLSAKTRKFRHPANEWRAKWKLLRPPESFCLWRNQWRFEKWSSIQIPKLHCYKELVKSCA